MQKTLGIGMRGYVELYLNDLKHGVKPGRASAELRAKGYPRTKRQLNRQIALVRERGSMSARVNKAGRKPCLSEEQMQEVDDFIEEKNANYEFVNRKLVQKFLRDKYGIKVKPQTVSNLLKRLRMSNRYCEARQESAKLIEEEKKTQFMTWIEENDENGRFNINKAKIISMDATYTGNPNKRQKTYAKIGSGKQKVRKIKKKYTDCIVTALSAAGGNPLPCLLFTFNPVVNPNQPNTPKGRARVKEFENAINKYGITEDRIYLVKRQKTAYYCRETASIFRSFLKHYENAIPKDALILHDQGPAYSQQGQSIFDTLGYTNHVTYPPGVHEHVSPNDNNLHGAAKAKWRNEYDSIKSDFETSLRLMQLIDIDAKKHSKMYFKRNILEVTWKSVGSVLAT